ncbi:choice-of-anchor D domain-containing protein [Flavobacterium algicola]|nr:choice-of-anchor D domain-containing protein [Flavobacterium algicola]
MGDGNPGNTPGGGGGGAYGTYSANVALQVAKNGGKGGNGQVVLTYNCPTYSFSSILATDTSPNNYCTITVSNISGGLPAGSYTIIYNLSGSNTATGNIAPLEVNASGTGTFNTNTLASAGSTTITVTQISSGTGGACNSAPIINNSSNFTVLNAPTINVSGNSLTIINGDATPSTTDYTHFGNVQVSSAAVSKNYTITNNGTAPLLISSTPTISGANASDFIISIPPATTIAAGSSTTFQVSCNTSTVGAKNATINISSNDIFKNPYKFAIQAEGVQYFYDSDGDGILDDADLDDDNDGILDTTEENNCRAVNGYAVNYKFLNETFGAGTNRVQINTTYPATTSYCFQDATNASVCEGGPNSTDLNDGKYTVASTAQVAQWAPSIWWLGGDHTGDTDGRMALFNASYTKGTFYTAEITGALPNVPVTYSFYILNLDRITASGRIKPNIKVEFRDLTGVVLQTITTGDIQNDETWHQFTANLTLPTNAFKVVFINENPGGLGNDLALDDIVITQTLCDRDNDGIADVFDLDADNDGIEDVIEAGLGYLTNGTGRIDAVSWVDTNGNGIHDAAESVAALPTLDSDGDGVPNYLDLDSDNDSLFDVDESHAGNTNAAVGFENGDGDITGDGVGDGPESEAFREQDSNGDGVLEWFGDGILDVYDYGKGVEKDFTTQYGNRNQGVSNTNPATTYLQDTDGDGIPDYLDIMSDGINWDISNNIKIYDYKILDANNDGIIDGTVDIDKDGIIDTFDTNTAQFGSPRDLRTKLFLDFDGRNDYADSTPILGDLPAASLMAWINLKTPFTGTSSVIIGQNNFQLIINASKNLEVTVNGTTISYTSTTFNESQWYHVAAVFDGVTKNIKLYLNGSMVASVTGPTTTGTDSSKLTIGKAPDTNSLYFKGKIDEVRVFNIALTDSQLQRMVYQEIKNFGGEIRGEIVPKNVATSPSSLPFTNLLRYYRMDNYKDDVIDDLTTLAIDVTGTKIYNHKNIYIQEAPMPFLTERSGNLAEAVNSPTKEIRGLDIMEQDWSIVKISHDITETVNNIDLGMIVDSNKTIVASNDMKVQNDWYLKLDGKIDLVGKSQLVQTTESDLDVASTGFIERDQQGQGNLYNYNYWASPVGRINTTENNTDHSISEVLRDGTTTIPKTINWVDGYDGAASSPISIARYWLYKFDNYANAYANWSQILETGTVRAGQGFTMKGNQGPGTSQNYTFVGKPNNGTISTNTVGASQLLLTGNPYPSALDSKEFINDNLASIDGTIYFWEHYTTNNTHILRDYQGGYAVLNLTGGTPTSSSLTTLISGNGTTAKDAPNRYIPVGQGFFVYGKTDATGDLTFKNSQRGFQRENDSLSNYTFKQSAAGKTIILVENPNDSIIDTDKYKKVRLGYTSAVNFHRQVLLGFMNEKASNNFDNGYDAYLLDAFPNDMSFNNNGTKLVIQGEGFFDPAVKIPLAVKADQTGTVSFNIDSLENFDNTDNFYIYDKENDSYNDIKEVAYKVSIEPGEYLDRFALTFKDLNKILKDDFPLDSKEASITVTHLQDSNNLYILNTAKETIIYAVKLFDISGKAIYNWDTEKLSQSGFQLPLKKLSAGVYIVVLNTSNGKKSQQIIIP